MTRPRRGGVRTLNALGPARIGAAVRTADWLDAAATIEPGSIDFIYADPPFNTGVKKAGRAGAYADAWRTLDDYLAWLRARLAATVPLLKPTGCLLLHLDYRSSHRARVLLDELLGADRFVNHIVWRYGLGGSSPRSFARKHDDILFYCVDPRLYYFDAPRVPASSRRMRGQTKKASDVLDIPSINNMARERTGYPTQKPLALLEVLVKACCPPAGTVLDPCCGSGTTLVAAIGTGRAAVGFDISPRATELTLARLAALGGGDGHGEGDDRPRTR